MNAQELANTYNGVSRLGAFAAASVTYQGWVTLSDARHSDTRVGVGRRRDERVDFAALAAVLALNALASDKTRAPPPRRHRKTRSTRSFASRRARSVGDPGARAGHALRAGSRERPERAPSWKRRDSPSSASTTPGTRRAGGVSSRLERPRRARAPATRASVALHAPTLRGMTRARPWTKASWRAFETAALCVRDGVAASRGGRFPLPRGNSRRNPPRRETGWGPATAAWRRSGRRAAEILVEEASSSSQTLLFDEQATFVAADALGNPRRARAERRRRADDRARRRTDPGAAFGTRWRRTPPRPGARRARSRHDRLTRRNCELHGRRRRSRGVLPRARARPRVGGRAGHEEGVARRWRGDCETRDVGF